MKNFLDKIKNNKKKTIFISIVLVAFILFIVFLIAIIKFLMPNTKASVYGDRCEITANYPINDDRKNSIREFFKDYDKIKLVDIDVKCNLIDIVIEVDEKENFKNVKAMGKKLLEVFDKEELERYDIELMVKSTDEKSDAQIGTHHKMIDGKMNNDFVW